MIYSKDAFVVLDATNILGSFTAVCRETPKPRMALRVVADLVLVEILGSPAFST